MLVPISRSWVSTKELTAPIYVNGTSQHLGVFLDIPPPLSSHPPTHQVLRIFLFWDLPIPLIPPHFFSCHTSQATCTLLVSCRGRLFIGLPNCGWSTPTIQNSGTRAICSNAVRLFPLYPLAVAWTWPWLPLHLPFMCPSQSPSFLSTTHHTPTLFTIFQPHLVCSQFLQFSMFYLPSGAVHVLLSLLEVFWSYFSPRFLLLILQASAYLSFSCAPSSKPPG